MVFNLFIKEVANVSFIPLLIWIYSVIMAPLGYMAKSEPPDAVGTHLGLIFAQLGFVSLFITWFFDIDIGYTALFFLMIIFALIPLRFLSEEI